MIEYDEEGLPVHLPMPITKEGRGPADAYEADRTACWCVDGDRTCTKFYGRPQ